MDSLDRLDIMDTHDTEPKRWVDVPGWPRAHTYSDHGFRLLVLTDELETGLIGCGPIWVIVCRYCRETAFGIKKKDVMAELRKGRYPSCGCRKPGHENFRGNYREHFH